MDGMFSVIFIALFASDVFCVPDQRLKRSYSDNDHAGLTTYGIGSDERDASIENSAPCGLLDSNSREHGYGLGLNQDHHRGVSTSVKAAAAASATSYS